MRCALCVSLCLLVVVVLSSLFSACVCYSLLFVLSEVSCLRCVFLFARVGVVRFVSCAVHGRLLFVVWCLSCASYRVLFLACSVLVIGRCVCSLVVVRCGCICLCVVCSLLVGVCWL